MKTNSQPKPEGYIVKHEHSEKCCIVGTKNMFYLLRGGYWRNHYGNVSPKRGNFVFWHEIVCNDPSCNYLGVISDEKISEFICKLDKES